MPRNKLIYTVKGVFTNLLTDVEKENFIIPTYQRGYKWKSFNGKGQVDILMRDLKIAFDQKSERKFLQFITLKEMGKELEVIDGQQRLTTITILCSVLALLNDIHKDDNFVAFKLKFQTRQNFLDKFIYNKLATIINEISWESFVESSPEYDNQDVFYLFHSTRSIHTFIIKELNGEFLRFNNFLSDNVYLIINLLDSEMNSEKVFINVNKGVKLNDEDLVKGLLITKLPLDQLGNKYRWTDNEINELRSNIGRQWDEIINWTSSSDIRNFYKIPNDSNQIKWLIELAFPLNPFEINDDEHPMFSFFDSQYKSKTETAISIFNKIRRTKLILNDWFNDSEISNLLGYILHNNAIPLNKLPIWKELNSFNSKNEIIKLLKKNCLKLLPLNSDSDSLKRDLNYIENRLEISRLFLILDVMKFLPINGRRSYRYDFSKIAGEHWSIEHIYPQSIQDLKGIQNLTSEDLVILKELLPVNRESVKTNNEYDETLLLNLFDKIITSKTNCPIDAEEKKSLAILLSSNAPQLHTLGNLSLLTKNVNSSLSNHFFDRKRQIIVQKVSQGIFVPFHTYDVFSKLIITSNTSLHIWSKEDIESHSNYIDNKIKEVIIYLKS